MILLDIPTGLKTTIMLVALVAVFYLFLIRPQSQKDKKERAYRDSLKKGDQVMTSTGIHALFVSRDNNMATIEVASGHRIKVLLASLNPIPTPKDNNKKI